MHKNKLYSSIIIVLISFLNVSLLAQQRSTVSLSKEELKSAVLTQNEQLQRVQLDEKLAASRYKQTEAIFLPQIGLSYAAMVTNNPLNAFGFRLQQSTVTAVDFDPAKLNNPGNTGDFMTRIELQQPIINPDMWQQRKAAAGMQEVAKLQTIRAKEQFLYEAEKTFAQLQYLYEAEKVVKDALITANEVIRFTTNRYQQGLLQQSDVLNTNVFKSKVETQLAGIHATQANASAYLNYLMGRKDTTLIYQPNTPLTTGETPILRTDGLQQRADIAAMQAGINANEYLIKGTKQSRLPKLNGFAQYQWNDNAALGFGANAYFAGLQLTWNVFGGNKLRNQLATQQIEQSKMKQDLVVYTGQQALALQQNKNDLIEAQAKIKQTQLAAEQARDAFRIMNNRYQQGLINTTDLLLTQSQMNQQALAHQEAILHQQLLQLQQAFLNPTK